MKRFIATLAASAAVALVLTGCAPQTTPQTPTTSGFNQWVQMDDGRVVYCYFYDRGVSCDWDNARTTNGSEF